MTLTETEFNKTSTTRYQQNLFTSQGSIRIKVSITYQGNEKLAIKELKNPMAFIDYSLNIGDVYEKRGL